MKEIKKVSAKYSRASEQQVVVVEHNEKFLQALSPQQSKASLIASQMHNIEKLSSMNATPSIASKQDAVHSEHLPLKNSQNSSERDL